ncbi:signal peptidase I W [Oceanobacillus picturae]|jgi:signal peptidase I|uniref:Signal peptidase I n=1 Tax=Oceanobacillus picturae TaxID=171693 RepID=W9B9V6_9BACI|nr:signal peptidase I [Oceanobacillus picturae]RIU94483.1 signal peptidase I [Oceanobacillus picturae]GAQ19190.1 signal peptidase I W [Oceanobacillus picturae]CDO03280.1 Signal peptidase I W [Oceanobacillus picturae]
MSLKQVKKWVSRITTYVLFAALIVMAVVVVSSKASGGEPEIAGYQLKTVLSGSMEPGIQTGSLIAVKPDGDMKRFKDGDVITFMDKEEKLITHRITEVMASGEQVMYRTKGDNNNAEDLEPVLSENVVAEYTGFTIPYLGYLVNFAQSRNGAFLLLIPGILLLCYSGLTIWRTLGEIEKQNKKGDQKLEEGRSLSS